MMEKNYRTTSRWTNLISLYNLGSTVICIPAQLPVFMPLILKTAFTEGAIQPLKSLNLLENKNVVIHFDQFHILIKECENELISCIAEWFPFVTIIALFWMDEFFFSCSTIAEWIITALIALCALLTALPVIFFFLVVVVPLWFRWCLFSYVRKKLQKLA